MTLLIASLAPVFIILFYIYFRDRYEREPLGLLLKSLVAGMVIVLPVIPVENVLSAVMPSIGRVSSAAYHGFVVAGFTEEVFKFTAVYLLVWRNPEFNEKFDGIVYAVFVSLGFAAVENVLYVVQGGVQTALIRAFTAVPAHALFGVTMGYYLGIAHMYKEIRRENLIRAIFFPVLLHGLYDFILLVESGWLLLFFVPYIIYLYYSGMKKMKILSDASIFRSVDEEEPKLL